MKKLVIINGVTGALGSACLAEFSREPETDIIGLSRKALPAETFCINNFLASNTMICSIGNISDPIDCDSFARKINKSNYSEVIYVHAVGVYPFEIDESGEIQVSHDFDNDGVDDRVVDLSYNAFFAMTKALQVLELPLSALIFGGIADKFEPPVHRSWWTVMQRVKDKMKQTSETTHEVSFVVLNISSVICPNEIITRPFVFQKTNADPRFWLMPHEVAQRVRELTLSMSHGLVEDELFHKSSYYEEDYFKGNKFTQRKKNELGIISSHGLN